MTRPDGKVPLIAHVIFRLDVGGLENGLVNLINSTPRDRYRHAIICLTDHSEFRERLEDKDIPIYSLHKQSGKDLGVYVRLWRLLRQLAPEIVHTRNLTTVDMVIPAVLAGVPHRIHGEHGWDMVDLHGDNVKYRWLRRSCRWAISRYITVSGQLADWLHDRIGVPRSRIRHICNGVDTGKFYPGGKDRSFLRDAAFAPPGTIVVGTVGRIVDVKDQRSLVQAFLELVNQSANRRAKLRLVIVGDGPLRPGLQQMVAAAGAEAVAWFPGQRNDIDRLLRSMDIFVLPSLNEGISNTVLEAMASGLPVIATDTGGNSELVENGATGYLVPVSKPDALARAIDNYIREPGLLVEHGARARRRAEKRFSLERMVEDYLSVYDELLGSDGPEPRYAN